MRDPTTDRRTYRTGNFGWIYAFAAVWVVLGVGFFVGFASAGKLVAAASCALVGVGIAVYVIASCARYEVILHGDSIEVADLFGRRTFHRVELRGRRLRWASIAFVVRDEVTTITALSYVDADEALQQWVDSLPDLDALERQAREASILSRANLGTDDDARVRTLAQTRKVGRAVTALSVAISAAAVLRPGVPTTALLLALPPAIVIFALRGRGLYTLDEPRDRVRTSLFSALIAPFAATALLAFRAQPLDERPLGAALALLGVCGVGFIIGTFVQPKLQSIAAAGGFAALHVCVAFVLANAAFDRSTPEEHRVTVEGKRIVQGRDPYRLRLAAWSARPSEEVDVGESLWKRATVGAPICIDLHRGALGFAWVRRRSCE